MTSFSTRAEAGEDLREQAASCRRLARKARTPSGSEALRTVALQFEADATRIDETVLDGVKVGDAAALVRVRLALEGQTIRWLRPQGPPSA